jgi:hypothetical protein
MKNTMIHIPKMNREKMLPAWLAEVIVTPLINCVFYTEILSLFFSVFYVFRLIWKIMIRNMAHFEVKGGRE